MYDEGDGTLQRKIDSGRCPKCSSNMSFKENDSKQDYMSCRVCGLVMLTPRSVELDIVVELD